MHLPSHNGSCAETRPHLYLWSNLGLQTSYTIRLAFGSAAPTIGTSSPILSRLETVSLDGFQVNLIQLSVSFMLLSCIFYFQVCYMFCTWWMGARHVSVFHCGYVLSYVTGPLRNTGRLLCNFVLRSRIESSARVPMATRNLSGQTATAARVVVWQYNVAWRATLGETRSRSRSRSWASVLEWCSL